MCGGGLGKTLLDVALPIIGNALGGPIGGAIGGGIGAANGGGGPLQDVLGAATGGFGGALSGAQGALIPEGTFLGGINSGISSGVSSIGSGLSGLYNGSGLQSGVNGLTDAFSPITNAASSFGSDISNGLSNAGSAIGNGLSFGSSNAATGDGLTDEFSNAAYAPSSAASSAPGTVASGFTPTASTGGALGGGTSGGFFQNAESGLGAGNSGGGFLDPSPTDAFSANNATFNAIQPANGNFLDSSALSSPIGGATAPSTAQTSFDNAGSQLLGSKGMDLSSIFSGGGNNNSNLVNGALRGGLSSLFNQNPYSGSPEIANTLNQSAAKYNPYIEGGGQAQTALSNLYGLNGADAQTQSRQNWQNTPGYQFQLQQGQGALQNSAAASGGLLNGNTGQALVNYGQGLANTTYQQYLQNLQQQAGQGQGAVGAQGSLQGQAAALNQQPKSYQANQTNQGLGNLFGSLFPSQQTNNGGGLLSLFS